MSTAVKHTPASLQAFRALKPLQQGSLAPDASEEAADLWNTVEEAVSRATDPGLAVRIIAGTIAAAYTQTQDEEVARLAQALGAEVVEVDPAAKPDSIKSDVHGWYCPDPTPRLVFVAGQTPAHRLLVARTIAAELGVTA